MPKNNTAISLARAIETIDFTATNAEFARLDAELALMRDKAAEAETEAARLAEAVRAWAGPDPDTIADAIIAGQSPSEATQAAPTREGLVDQRTALLATARAFRDRQQLARQKRDEVAETQRLAIVDAAQEFIAEQTETQVLAAKTIADADAALQALRWVTGLHVPGAWASRSACRAVTGSDSLLGPIARLPVPAGVVAALAPLADRAKGLNAPVRDTVIND